MTCPPVSRSDRPRTPVEQRLRDYGAFYLLWNDDAFLVPPAQARALGLAYEDQGHRSAHLTPPELVVVRA
jgi:hypothetical protein